MSKDQKRYRQINIMESFALSKKTKSSEQVPTMKENLRDLMAAAAESRLLAQTEASQQTKVNTTKNDAINHINHGASTSKEQTDQWESVVQSSEENELSCSVELFSDSQELLTDSPVVEQCSSQETEILSITDPSSYPPSSPEIFSQIEETNSQVEEEEDSTDEVQLSFFNRKPNCSIPLPPLEPLENHAIMFSPHIRPGDAPRPYPSTYRDKWDGNHVRMPCSPFNKYPVENLEGEKEIRSRWELICRSLSRPINSAQDLENAIMQYNTQYRAKWNFNNLHTFLDNELSEDERTMFFDVVLPKMVKMTLDLPNTCTQPPPLLKKDRDSYVTMSQKQIACLLLNAFFCTFPRRIVTRYKNQKFSHEYSNYPDINFNRLFFGVKNKNSTSIEKLKCLITYFRRISSKEPTGTVTFHRQCLKDIQSKNWRGSTKGIRSVVVKSDGLIESDGHGMLQVDFANKFIGGGVLGHGCVQEEIRFVICPELIVSRLFTECLEPSEVLIITGVEQYCDYTGYSDTFKWEGSHVDQTPRDAWGRRCTEIVAMDATHFTNIADQFKLSSVHRELTKAYCGFYENSLPANLPAVATGNWGCGAFNGYASLKFYIQLMAASEAGRDLLYFTFGNKTLKRELKTIASLVVDKNLVVGDLCRILISYCLNVTVTRKGPNPTIIDHLKSVFSDVVTIDDSSPTNQSPIITDSDKNAIEKLLEAVEDIFSVNYDAEKMTEDEAIFDPLLKKKKKKKKMPFDPSSLEDNSMSNDGNDYAQDEVDNAKEDMDIDDREDTVLDLDDFSGLKKKKKKKKQPFNEDGENMAESDSRDESSVLTEEKEVDDNGVDDDLDFSLPKKKKKKKKINIDDLELEAPEEDEDDDTKFEEVSEPKVILASAISAWIGTDRDYTFDELLLRVFNLMREKNPDMVAGEKKPFILRPPQVLRVGTKKTSFANFIEICKMVHRQPRHLQAFLLAELGTSGSVDANNQLIIKGRFQQKQIENVLRRYIKEYVTCHTCRSSDTILQKDTRLFFLQCEKCGSRCSVASIKSGFQAVTGKRAAIRAKTA
ncbi:hypothetical protein JTE90_005818 [Oedothorax gibbosus]|uniref:Eukaryotic translation initiation factor 2 subunit 2 n=2 Tax=Arthropoda TaxID=6656 RepID=A0AAV6V1X6_9ARAC|nr:hypothetical protein JTE90_005818 [Oedothorax gibbosus]